MKYIISFVFISVLLSASPLWSQRVIISEDVRVRTGTPESGMNRRHFHHPFMGVSFAFPPDEAGARIEWGRSHEIFIGYRYKRRYNDLFSGGYDLSLSRKQFVLKQEEGKLVPDNILHKSEKLVFLSGRLGLYQRLNFGSRGDHLGNYLDAVVWLELPLHVRNISFDETEAARIKTRKTRLDYPQWYAYGWQLRLGLGSTVLTGSYRLSDVFRSRAVFPELPRLQLGIELGLNP